MTETIDVELARALSKAGGIGLAEIIQRSMTRANAPGMAPPAQPVPAVTESPSGPAGISTRAPAVSLLPPASDLRIPLETATTSQFGWRSDPFHGARTFHAGVDLAGAYGQIVPVAGDGRVSYVGEQGAYGLTVVVEHPDGVQTRYAHLSGVRWPLERKLQRARSSGVWDRAVGRPARISTSRCWSTAAAWIPTQVAQLARGSLKHSGLVDD